MQDSASEDHSSVAIAVRSFVAVVSTGSRTPPPAFQRERTTLPNRVRHFSADGRADLTFDNGMSSVPNVCTRRKINLVLGPKPLQPEDDERLANTVRIHWDPERGLIRVVSSIVGLPPIFILRQPGLVAVASHVCLLREVSREAFMLDPDAVIDVYTTGYPLDGRTLFNQVCFMPGGHSFALNTSGSQDLQSIWDPPQDSQPFADWTSYLQSQEAAFKSAISNLRLSGSLLSLTGGIDTRAILALVAGTGGPLTAYTTSGSSRLSLDARLAKRLCRAYGISHSVVTLDNNFLRSLPDLTLAVSLLSGGLSSVEQAHEVYVYEQLRGLGSTRISGYLGNQLGRGGVEQVATRGGDIYVLAEPHRHAAENRKKAHWLTQAFEKTHYSLPRLLIQHEVPFSSVANYAIGSYFMEQQSPYASRRLIELAFRCPIDSNRPRVFSATLARINDVRHRFLGHSVGRSFQRRLITAAGGFAAECPINWGWKAAGGVSMLGLAWGVRAFTDAVASGPGSASIVLKQARRILGAEGLHDVRPWHA